MNENGQRKEWTRDLPIPEIRHFVSLNTEFASITDWLRKRIVPRIWSKIPLESFWWSRMREKHGWRIRTMIGGINSIFTMRRGDCYSPMGTNGRIEWLLRIVNWCWKATNAMVFWLFGSFGKRSVERRNWGGWLRKCRGYWSAAGWVRESRNRSAAWSWSTDAEQWSANGFLRNLCQKSNQNSLLLRINLDHQAFESIRSTLPAITATWAFHQGVVLNECEMIRSGVQIQNSGTSDRSMFMLVRWPCSLKLGVKRKKKQNKLPPLKIIDQTETGATQVDGESALNTEKVNLN